MLFHNLLLSVMELAEDRRRQRTTKSKAQPSQEREDLVLDALDVTYEDVLEYYRYSVTNEQENDQESA